MSGFFKKTFAFLGLSDEDEVDLEGEEKRDKAKKKNRKSEKETARAEPMHMKEDTRRGRFLTSKPSRKTPFAGVGKGGSTSRVFIAEPGEFEEIQVIADNFKENIPVIINLQKANQELAKRVIDFCSGLTYAMEGNIKKVADKVFLITPYNVEVSSEDKELLREEGFYDQF